MSKIRRLLCFDFDGTLVDSYSKGPVLPSLLRRIGILRELQGTPWVISTGRRLSRAIAGIGEHRVSPGPDYLIVKEREIYRRCKESQWLDFGEWNGRCRSAHAKLFRSHARIFEEVRDYLIRHTMAEFVENVEEPAGILSRSEKEMDRLSKFLDQLLRELPELSYERNGSYLRFAHSSYNKGTALRELGRLLSISPNEVFAAGDNYNDLSMLSGHPAKMVACPGNAVPVVQDAVRAAGGFVASTNAGIGMEQALDHYFFDESGCPKND